MKILVLTLFDTLGASSRERFLLYFNSLERHNIEFIWKPLLTNDMILKNMQAKKGFGVFKIVFQYFSRLKLIRLTEKYDLIWLEYEGFPLIPFWFEKLSGLYKKKVLVNYDDAIFHKYDNAKSIIKKLFLRNKIRKVMSHSAAVIVGNYYLREYAEKSHARKVYQIPTVVDTNIYHVSNNAKKDNIVKIGWLGSPSTQHHLISIIPAIERLGKRVDIQLCVMGVSDNFIVNSSVDIAKYKWSEKNQIEFLQNIDIGVMPLKDELFARGKCGYKLIQYMACGKPVVGTPLGASKDIIDHGINGFYAEMVSEWMRALYRLCMKKDLRAQMGMAGRRKVESFYSVKATSGKILKALKNVN